MSRRVSLTDRARRQLDDAAEWWSKNRSAEQAERWADLFTQAILDLGESAQRQPRARESKSLPIELRELLFGLGKKPSHRALFAIRPDQVVVYAIRHVSQSDVGIDDL
ncbi:MAG: hypothetical protein CMJ58_21655 [Planctomycetaceae bacterium]|nr:hypothetical protein [Planctomycetaceae bacterium]